MKKKTHKQFLEEIRNITGEEYEVLETYEGAFKKIKFIHKKCGTEFYISPNKFLSGKRCPICFKPKTSNKKKNTEVFKKEVFDIVGNEYELLGEYEKANKKILLKHNICNEEFEMTPANFLHGQRCPKCKGKRIANKLLKTNEEFLNRVKDICLKEFGNEDEYIPLSEYKGFDKNIEFFHKECGKTFTTTPSSFLSKNTRCTNKECLHKRMSNSMKHTQEEFIDIFKKFDKNNEYELLSDYNGYKEKIKIKHLVCGEIFYKTVDNFLSGQICPKCSLEKLKKLKTKTNEEYKNQIEELYNGEFSVESEYIAGLKPIKIRHNVCGKVFELSAQNMLNTENNHCPFCNYPTKGEQKIINYLDLHIKEYKYQKRYKDLFGVNQGLLSYDFYIPKYNLLIEYQGEFHDGTARQQTEEEFAIQKEHDKRKRQYAKSHNINLLEIWYWDFDNIENILEKYLSKLENN